MVSWPIARFDALVLLGAQVDEGETQIINVRETDGRLGPLVFTLVALGCLTLVMTALFWWLTRPRRVASQAIGRDRPTKGEG